METTLGGDRLGSGNKQKVHLHGYERSSHDLSYLWRSSMASGTLTPFLTELGLNGDSFDIDLNCNIMTHPTIGPLFGSYKIQLDVFVCPVRLYNGDLHMNRLNIGRNMAKIKLPQIEMEAISMSTEQTDDNAQINPSSILAYQNIRGLGISTETTLSTITRQFNGVPYLGYWDIYKNYYANKQEEIGAVIHNDADPDKYIPVVTAIWASDDDGYFTVMNDTNTDVTVPAVTDTYPNGNFLDVFFPKDAYEEVDPSTLWLTITEGGTGTAYPLTTLFTDFQYIRAIGGTYKDYFVLSCFNPVEPLIGITLMYFEKDQLAAPLNPLLSVPKITTFPLENIDQMREDILKYTGSATPYIISKESIDPYGLTFQQGTQQINGRAAYSKQYALEGLALKTYQSDLFNNWISTEWIDGVDGISAVTAIDTSGGEFTIDTLNLSRKVYLMLNRIAISGGTYDDWQEVTYDHKTFRRSESPMYMGGLSKELEFQEVISNSAAVDTGTEQPLGTLAGRGVMSRKHKGGSIKINIDEPSYIIGLVSITPRIDYSQGNKWDVNLKTMDDFHKPQLDEIGFQDLITDQMDWRDTKIDTSDVLTYKSAGKQPAWINYMTNVNQVRGNFAIETEQMFMTLNRQYTYTAGTGIQDLTTYVDPSKFNHIFANTRIDAQNFWTQISVDIHARRKMSAKIMPNL